MSIILNIETSSTNCSVSISEEGRVIDFVEQNFEQYSHSKSLHIFIDKLFKKTEIPLADLTAVSISEGPGSYTGLRIGVSAAKGICFALDIPLIAIDTMYILARKIECSKGYIISAMDARLVAMRVTARREDQFPSSSSRATRFRATGTCGLCPVSSPTPTMRSRISLATQRLCLQVAVDSPSAPRRQVELGLSQPRSATVVFER